MKTNKRKQSLEALIAQLADQPEPRNKSGRKRLEILAAVLWERALNGDDREALRLLIERLPKGGSPDYAPEPQHQQTKDPYTDMIMALKALTEAKIIPDQLFQLYVNPEGMTQQ